MLPRRSNVLDLAFERAASTAAGCDAPIAMRRTISIRSPDCGWWKNPATTDSAVAASHGPPARTSALASAAAGSVVNAPVATSKSRLSRSGWRSAKCCATTPPIDPPTRTIAICPARRACGRRRRHILPSCRARADPRSRRSREDRVRSRRGRSRRADPGWVPSKPRTGKIHAHRPPARPRRGAPQNTSLDQPCFFRARALAADASSAA